MTRLNRQKFIRVKVEYTIPINIGEYSKFLDKISQINSTIKTYKIKVYNVKRTYSRYDSIDKIREDRFNFILKYIPNNEYIQIGKLYKKLKELKSYYKTYKTLQRDITLLTIKGFIKSRIFIGGKIGTTTLLKKIKEYEYER